ncbi:kelch repeat protein [Colletotrichum plurivorum]|uniref:Kelch repeat protein n=1 Tax=Colletotrichum plurivorum TaxID=2175906 RepID=A0A8H6NN51_9PEZI|nr:kelch repeat protein [Colletotrichum plurivorum]
MVSRSFTAALLAVGQLATTCMASSTGQWDAPSADEYLRRVFPRTSVIGNYLYFDGGEVSQLVDGKNLTFRASNPVNSTLSLDLSTSWTPSKVVMKQTQKGSAPKMMRQAIFTDKSSNAFYIWGGFASYDGKPPDPQLWKFDTDSKGGGAWSTEIKPGHDAFTKLTRSQGGVYVSTPDSGFYFGGFSQKTSDPNPNGPVPGYLQFNFTSRAQAWTNSTDKVPYSQYGTIVGGAAHYVSSFGPNGLVMLFGGGEHIIGDGQASDNVGYLSFGTLYFMDPVTKVWYSQKTSGTAPSPRMWHCAVGAEGSDGTYEIFIFGGSNTAADTAYDEVYILSLPGFVWTKANYESASPRDCMGCALAGQRQMITIGGINRKLGVPTFFKDRDPFPQGLGIFDLTELKWKDQYDAGAANYQSPAAVKAWYDEGNLDKVEYTSKDVAQLFSKKKSGTGSGSGSDDDDSGSSNVGAIAGGVVGGVVGAALIGAAAWFFVRRRKRHQGQVGSDPATAEAAPYAAGHQQHDYSPVPPTLAPSELAGDRDYQTPPPPQAAKANAKLTPELDSNPNPTTFYELDGSGTHK